jgi:cation diffusion facilitator CzcD-associated flavoprotein CzcO
MKDEYQWLVAAGRTDSGEILHYRCDILINASGNLNRLKIPKIPGIKSFKGEVLHTAAWDDTVNLEGKTVGVIGNGFVLIRPASCIHLLTKARASAAQLVVAIQPNVKTLVNIVHQPVYVAMQIPEPRPFTAEELYNFAECPGHLLEHRRKQERESNALFDTFISGSYRQAHLRSLVTGEMRERLEDNLELADMAIPDYEYGARPVVYCDGYLEALNCPNACLKVADITSIVADGVFCHVQKVTHTQGAPPKVDSEAESTPNDFTNLDVLIFATGFQTDFLPPFRIEGPAGRLSDLWKEEPKSYLGIGVANFPNYMTFLGKSPHSMTAFPSIANHPFLGPNSLTTNGGSVLPVIEAQADYMLYWFNRFQTEQVLQFSPKPAAVTHFIAHKNKFMASTVFQSPNVSSWYKGNPPSHNITALWPGSHLHYLECLRKPRADDWDVTYIGNRFEYLGSGFSQVEGEQSDADWSYYIRDHDFSMGFGGLGTSVRWDRERLVRSGTCVEGGLKGYKWGGGKESTVFRRGSWLDVEDDSEGEE